MSDRNPMLEMLVLESKGVLNIDARRIIEMCSGWNEGACDDEMLYRKYIEAYHYFLSLNTDYVKEHVESFGIVVLLEDIEDRISDGHDYKTAVVMTIRNALSITHFPLAEPPHEWLSEKYVEGLKLNPDYLQFCMFDGRIEKNSIYLEIVEN